MNVTCDKCNKRYAIADDKVRGKSVKIRCKQCQNLISVQGPPASGASPAPVQVTAAVAMSGGVAPSPWEDERTRAMPALDLSPTWFAMVKGKQLGPLTLRDLEARVKTAEISLRTYLWKQGMSDWKRASDVPEVSTVFAGVSVGASAVGQQTAAPPATRPVSKSTRSVARDVATANELPSPEITRRPNGGGNGNGNGNGHGETDPYDRDARTLAGAPYPVNPATTPTSPERPKVKTGSTGAVPRLDAPPRDEAPKSGSRGAVERKTGNQLKPVEAKTVSPVAPTIPEPTTAPQAKFEPMAEPAASTHAPLNDLFNDVSGLNAKGDTTGEGEIGGIDPHADVPAASEDDVESAPDDKQLDPFAALGEADPSEAPPPGEATKFFIAQAGVNKRNPPWKIALFVLAIVGLPAGALYLLSSLHVVPPVLVANDKGEMVEQSFFTPTGLSVGIKDLLSGDAKKKKEQAEAQRRAAAEKAAEARRIAKANIEGSNGNSGGALDDLPDRRGSKKEEPKYTKEELEKLYGSSGPVGSDVNLGSKNDVGPKIRLESQAPTVEKGGGLDADAVAKTMGERMKALVGCVEDALKRNPNVKLEKVVLVLQVGTSGAVKGAGLEPKRLELTDWGGCIRDRAKKITFPPADSESEIQIPLVLGAAIQ